MGPMRLKVEVAPIEEMLRRSTEPYYRFRVTANDGRQEYTDEVIVSETELLSRFDTLFKVAQTAIGCLIRRERPDAIITPAPGVRWTFPPPGEGPPA